MARYGINTSAAYGVSLPKLRQLAKELGRDHGLAGELWAAGVHEARMLACFIDDPRLVDDDQLERWVSGFDSWDLCDQCVSSLFDRTALAYEKAFAWSKRPEEFVKRAGFAMMAALAVHDKTAADDRLAEFLPVIKREAFDERNFVKKAVNWALRQIGKRNLNLNRAAIAAAEEIQRLESPTARWIAADALRELNGEAVQERLKAKAAKANFVKK